MSSKYSISQLIPPYSSSSVAVTTIWHCFCLSPLNPASLKPGLGFRSPRPANPMETCLRDTPAAALFREGVPMFMNHVGNIDCSLNRS